MCKLVYGITVLVSCMFLFAQTVSAAYSGSLAGKFQETTLFSLNSASQLYGFFTTDHRSVTLGGNLPAGIQLSGGTVSFSQKGGIFVDNPAKNEPFYKVSVILSDANQQALAAYLTVIDQPWSSGATSGASSGFDTNQSANTYWWDHTQLKTQSQVSDSQWQFSRRAKNRFILRRTGDIPIDIYVTPNGTYTVIDGANFGSFPDLYTGSYTFRPTTNMNYIVLGKWNAGGDAVTFKNLTITKLDSSVASVDEVNAYFIKKTLESSAFQQLINNSGSFDGTGGFQNALWAAFLYRGFDYYFGTNNITRVRSLFDQYLAVLPSYVDGNIPSYGTNATQSINHSFINSIQSNPIVAWGLSGYLTESQREAVRVQFAKVVDKIMEYTRPFDSDARFRFPYGIHYRRDTFAEEVSWILATLTGYYAAYPNDSPRSAKILEYIKFYGFHHLSDGKSLRQVYGSQAFTYLPDAFQDFVSQYIWPTGEIDNHDFFPSLNYAQGIFGTAAIVRNILEKTGTNIPQVSRNLDLTYTKHIPELLDISTMHLKRALPKYDPPLDWIAFDNFGDQSVNKTHIAPNVPATYRLYLIKPIQEVKLWATANNGQSWTQIAPTLTTCPVECWWTWTPPGEGTYTLSANVMFTDGTACSGNPFIPTWPAYGFDYCGDMDRFTVTVMQNPPAPTSPPSPVMKEDVYNFAPDGTIIYFYGKSVPSRLEDWGSAFTNWSIPEEYGDYATATPFARNVYFAYYSGAGKLFCRDQDVGKGQRCSAATNNFNNYLFGDALYSMLNSRRSQFNPNEGPVVATPTPTPTSTLTPAPTLTPTPIPGDVTVDRKVNIVDIIKILTQWNSPYNIFDYNLTVANYGGGQ